MTSSSFNLTNLSFAAAAIIVLVFLAGHGWLFWNLLEFLGKPKDDAFSAQVWNQISYLLSSFGNIAMMAAGVLLGVGVQERNVKSAKDEADVAKKRVVEKDDKIKAAKQELEKEDKGKRLRDLSDSRIDEAERQLNVALTI